MESVVEKLKTIQCPFSNAIIPCMKQTCDDCEIRQAWERAKNDRIASRMEDYWRHQSSGAEGDW